MTQIIKWAEIEPILSRIDVISEMKKGFVAYSEGKVVVPPVGELLFEDPPGDTHIKYGHIINDDFFVIKVASGFYNNPELGLSSSQGVNLLFSSRTGVLEAVLLDEGNLTNIRTAAAGACIARHLAPSKVENVGILGAGIQGRLQLEYLLKVISPEKVYVYDRLPECLDSYKSCFKQFPICIDFAEPAEIAAKCNYIVTATPSETPILQAGNIRKGTHITAVGSDTPEKQELDSGIIGKADLVVADSIPQCRTRGEIFHALKDNQIRIEQLAELGSVISGKSKGRENDEQVTVADLTGVAVQDIQITKAVFEHFRNNQIYEYQNI